MTKNSKTILSVFILCFFLSSLLVSSPFQEEQIDIKKLYKEISGKYEFFVDGQFIIISFYTEDGTLYGAMQGDNEVVEMVPVELENLSFEVTDMDGQFYEITFSRDEEKKVTKCVMLSEGWELEGKKIEGNVGYKKQEEEMKWK
jgi:hypothetical protein